MAKDEIFAEDLEEAEDSEEAGNSGGNSGPGFILGLIVGAAVGAAAATLFAPATGEELRQYVGDEAAYQPGENTESQSPMNRVRGVFAGVRSRVQEAAEEGQQAAQEAEEASRARYSELTHQEN